MKIETAVLTNAGGRQINDDTVSVLCREGTYVFVGDGLGGYAGGRQASQAAGEALMKQAEKGGLISKERMATVAEAANSAVCDLQEKTEGNMKTTLVFLAIEDGKAMWMHVGDSRLYHFRSGNLVCQTKDHSVVQMAVLLGQITQSQIRFHEDRNRVLRALGAEKTKPDVSAAMEITAGDAFLLCTDGFWEFVEEQEMERALAEAKTPRAWLDGMETILRSRIPDNTDNYTAAAVFCE